MVAAQRFVGCGSASALMMVHDMYVYQVKKPSESKYPWDYYKYVATIPGDKAFRPLDKGGCPLVK